MRFVVVLAMLGWAPVARAQLQDEIQGTRSSAMGGAHRGLGNSNDTLYLNPAGMSNSKRYAFNGVVGFVPELWRYNISVIDSQTSPVAGGLAYTFDTGPDTRLHRVYVGASYPISENMSFGVTNRYLNGRFKDALGQKREVSTFSADLGLMMRLSEGVSLGFSYNNMLKSKVPRLLPPTAGGGVGIQSGVFAFAADASVNLRKDNDKPWTFRVGGEAFLASAFPVRLGYAREAVDQGPDGFAEQHVVSGGVGWITRGFGLDMTYRRALSKNGESSYVGALQIFM